MAQSLRQAVPHLLKESKFKELRDRLADKGAVYTVTTKDLAHAMIVDHLHGQYHEGTSSLAWRMCQTKFLPRCAEDRHSLVELQVRPLDFGPEGDLPLPLQKRYKESTERVWCEEHDYRLSVLPLAALLGQTYVLAFLCRSCDANPNAMDSLSATTLTLAAASGRLRTLQVVHRLLKKSKVGSAVWKQQDESMRTPLREALDLGHVEMARYILKHSPSSWDFTLVCPVIERDDRDMLQLLLQTSEKQFLEAVQHLCREYRTVDCLHLLTRYRDVFRRGADTPLHTARPCLISPILQHFPEWLEARDSQGFTPLLRAVQSLDSLGRLEVLLSHDADLLVRDWQGRTAMHHLVSLPHCCERYRPYSTESYVPCVIDRCCQKMQWIHKIAKLQPDLVHLADNGGQTPLHHAFLRRQPDSVALLLFLDARPSVRDAHNQTPLGYIPDSMWLENMLVYAQLRVPRVEMVHDMNLLKRKLMSVCWSEHINALLLAMAAGWITSEEVQDLKASPGDLLSRWHSYKKRVPTVCQSQNLCGWSRSSVPLALCLLCNRPGASVPKMIVDMINYRDFTENLYTVQGLLLDKVLEEKGYVTWPASSLTHARRNT